MMVVAVACYKCALLERAAAWGFACLNRTATDATLRPIVLRRATVWSAEPVRAAARGGSGQVGQECADRTATHAPIDKMSFSELVEFATKWTTTGLQATVFQNDRGQDFFPDFRC